MTDRSHNLALVEVGGGSLVLLRKWMKYSISVIFTRHFVTKFAVFFLCPVTDMFKMVAPISMKFCMMVHISPGYVFSLFERGATGIPKSEIFGLNFGI